MSHLKQRYFYLSCGSFFTYFFFFFLLIQEVCLPIKARLFLLTGLAGDNTRINFSFSIPHGDQMH